MALQVPHHIAIIMDGNGRWAKSRGRNRTFGHIKGSRQAKKIIEECVRLGVKQLSLYAFSVENWNRPQTEVAFLMRMLQRYIQKEKQNLLKQNIRFGTFGDISRLPSNVVEEVEDLKLLTRNNSGMFLNLALNYSGRQEILTATKSIVNAITNGQLKIENLTESVFSTFLETASIKDPDLVIRTSGEYRLSNFMVWQSAYSEFYITPTLWPDFSESDLHLAILNYSKRQRRFGLTGDQVENQKRNLSFNDGLNEFNSN